MYSSFAPILKALPSPFSCESQRQHLSSNQDTSSSREDSPLLQMTSSLEVPNLCIGVEGLCPFNQFLGLLRLHPRLAFLHLDEQCDAEPCREYVDRAVGPGAPRDDPPFALKPGHGRVLLRPT